MIEFFSLYTFVFVLLIFISPVLALTGVHLPARSQTLKTLMTTQVAALGLLVGIFIGEFFELPELLSKVVVPLLLAFFLSVSVSAWARRFDCHSGESFYLIMYLFNLALTYLLCSVLPGLEIYQSQLFFGDVVTISGMTLSLSIVLSLIFLICLVLHQRTFLKNSIEFELLVGQSAFRPKKDHYELFSLFVIILGLYSLGMLFTLSTMLVAPVILHYRHSSLKEYLLTVVFISTFSAVLGLSLSLFYGKLSTVALIVVLNAIFSFTLLLISRNKSK
jgi:ABC-type Mn2+/Zn2+ transport system permease subunit